MAPTLPLMWCPGNKNKSRHGLYLDPVFARPDRWISLWSARRGSPAAARKWAGTRPSAAKANLSKVLPATFQKITVLTKFQSRAPLLTHILRSLPIGSVPKSFPPFEHPSHQLLGKNKFHSSNKGSFLNN
ncbi:hypothetical protein ACQJBY_045504 [Aegilops geniculata]